MVHLPLFVIKPGLDKTWIPLVMFEMDLYKPLKLDVFSSINQAFVNHVLFWHLDLLTHTNSTDITGTSVDKAGSCRAYVNVKQWESSINRSNGSAD